MNQYLRRQKIVDDIMRQRYDDKFNKKLFGASLNSNAEKIKISNFITEKQKSFSEDEEISKQQTLSHIVIRDKNEKQMTKKEYEKYILESDDSDKEDCKKSSKLLSPNIS